MKRIIRGLINFKISWKHGWYSSLENYIKRRNQEFGDIINKPLVSRIYFKTLFQYFDSPKSRECVFCCCLHDKDGCSVKFWTFTCIFFNPHVFSVQHKKLHTLLWLHCTVCHCETDSDETAQIHCWSCTSPVHHGMFTSVGLIKAPVHFLADIQVSG